VRERERHTNGLTLVYPSGEPAVLGEVQLACGVPKKIPLIIGPVQGVANAMDPRRLSMTFRAATGAARRSTCARRGQGSSRSRRTTPAATELRLWIGPRRERTATGRGPAVPVARMSSREIRRRFHPVCYLADLLVSGAGTILPEALSTMGPSSKGADEPTLVEAARQVSVLMEAACTDRCPDHGLCIFCTSRLETKGSR
jgi:hypothetical protein